MQEQAPNRTSPPAEGLSPDAVAVLAAEHARFLAFLERRVASREQAEDILQQAFVRALERGHTLRDGESAAAWFYRLLRNALVDHYRRAGAERRALEAVARTLDSQTEDGELMQTICQCVGGLVGTLKPSYAEILRRVDLEGVSIAQVARELGTSANNAGVRIHRAREALFRQLVVSCGTCATHGCLDCRCDATHGGAPAHADR
ncbi:MAG: sigma-70 family RNA polymerase sigma factor [Polyangiales bacterium]